MEINKTLILNASAQQIWELLLDPHAMAECVPGMQSIEVVSPEEYKASMKVKVSFISATFSLRTRIVEKQESRYLKAEGTGKDAAVASSLKHVTELFITERGDGISELKIKVNVDLLGRMGSFGLTVMKTKADRLWDEFGVKLAERLSSPVNDSLINKSETAGADPAATISVIPATLSASALPTAYEVQVSWWARLLKTVGIQPFDAAASGKFIVIEVQRPDQSKIRIEWPADKSHECAQWLSKEI